MIEDDLKPPARQQDRSAIKFDRLRLDGFKSFAERAEIDIEPGLTGIVGPNGCGKSNLLEALKWVLGETSARRMRGSGMDDVIFGGTERRPPRNTSEVSLILDNRRRGAPIEFNDHDTLEITRRIERGQGTSYRANGRPVRQRDVQILFQDNASGSGSSAIVSQGRVVALINAKATERRAVLEEAAGVSGLSARRHDTELKLNQTEQNLQRAEDALSEVTNQATVLRRQARQLIRFREIDSRIRAAQAMVLLIRIRKAEADLAKANSDHAEIEARITEAILAAHGATEAREAAVLALGPLREKRSAAETDLARATARLESIENEAERQAREIQEMQGRLLELAADRSREDQVIEEAERTIVRLREEQAEIAEKRSSEAENMEIASEQVETARDAHEEADAAVQKLSTELASREASRAAALKQKDEVERRVAAVEARLRTATASLEAITATLPDLDRLAELAASVEEAEAKLEAAVEGVGSAEARAETVRVELEALSADLAQKHAVLTGMRAEAGGLAAVKVATVSGDPVSGRVRIQAGYEAAVAAAFGEAMGAGTNSAEQQWWAAASAKAPTLPAGTRTLADVVTGVPELALAAAAVVAVDTDAEVIATASALPVGAMVVSKTGLFARWDGFSGRPVSNSVEAGLRRAARLRDLQEGIDRLAPEIPGLEARRGTLQIALATARREESEARLAVKTLTDLAKTTRDGHAKAQQAGEAARRQVAVAEVEVTGIRAERQNILQDLRDANNALADIPQDDQARQQLAEARAKLQAAREAEQAGRIALERLVNEQSQRRNRFEAIMRETTDWNRRLLQARERREDLSRRDREANAALAELEERKATPAEAVAEARQVYEATQGIATAAAAELESAERGREVADEAARTCDATLAAQRTDRAGIIAAIGQAQSASAVVLEAIQEKLNVAPEDLETIAEARGALPPLESAESQLHRLEAERTNFGPVNFLAEEELGEHEKRLGEMEKGRIEVRQAVETLRKAIKEIEEEARAKLEHAFQMIDRNFGELFRQLFAGGEAHLKLVGTDILEAGLEIYASPPGKRLQILSLLSGGEQTLTAMALIFAAFLSNPSPICVLDEADAALDDSNTDRLIRLVETMSRNDATRFLIITHSSLTMSRMNRLYGVTMGERGVSSLTSVNLDRAVEIAGQ